MATSITPPIRVTGIFKAAAPYDALLKENIRYTVQAIRTIPEMLALNIDVLNSVYIFAGATASNYSDDLAAKANIITLTSDGLAPVLIPSTSILSFPDDNGIKYEYLVVGLNLKLVPDTLKDQLLVLQQRLRDVTIATIGVDPEINIGVIPSTGYITPEQSRVMEANRQAKITNPQTDQATILELQRQNTQLRETVAYYEGIITNRS